MKMSFIGDDALFYVLTDQWVITVEVSEHYILKIPDNKMDFFRKHPNSTVTVSSNEAAGTQSKDIYIHAINSGYELQNLQEKVKLVITAEDDIIELNLDDYFTGFRKHIDVLSPDTLESLNSSVVKQPPTLSEDAEYPFSFINQDGKKQKGLAYIKNNIYLYID